MRLPSSLPAAAAQRAMTLLAAAVISGSSPLVPPPAFAAALPEAHHQSGGRLQEFVEMAFAWRYRSLLVTSGFLDLEGQPEMATSPAGGGVK